MNQILSFLLTVGLLHHFMLTYHRIIMYLIIMTEYSVYMYAQSCILYFAIKLPRIYHHYSWSLGYLLQWNSKPYGSKQDSLQFMFSSFCMWAGSHYSRLQNRQLFTLPHVYMPCMVLKVTIKSCNAQLTYTTAHSKIDTNHRKPS